MQDLNTTITPPPIIEAELAVGGGGAQIDDTSTSGGKTWSSTKIANEIANAVGGPGGSGDLNYKHDQMIASAMWVINHGLGKWPSVTVIDSAGNECVGNISYNDANTIALTFSSAFAGTAYLN